MRASTVPSLLAAPLALLAIDLSTPVASASTPHFAHASENERASFTRDFPQVRALLEEADAVANAGRLGQAVVLFENLRKMLPQNPTVLRRLCEVLTDLDRRTEALTVCEAAALHGQSVSEVRSKIGALMSGPRPAPLSDFVVAYEMTAPVIARRSHLPEGHAAMFDIAHHLGDRRLMDISVASLERVAPGSYETARARARLAPPSLETWLVRLGWIAILVLCVATALRRFGRAASAELVRKTLVVGIVALALNPIGVARAETPPPGHPTAEQLNPFPIDEKDPEHGLPTLEQANKDPVNFGYMVMDLTEKAESALKAGNFGQAIKYYQALVTISPDAAITFSKICFAYEQLNEREKAIAACRNAVARNGVQVLDYDRFVRLVLSRPGPLADADKKDVAAVISHLQADPLLREAAASVQCQYAVRIEDLTALASCTKVLVEVAPQEAGTIAYEWALAMARKDRTDARRVIDKARQSGVSLEGVEKMEMALGRGFATRFVPVAVAGGALGLGLAMLFLRRREMLAGLLRRHPS